VIPKACGKGDWAKKDHPTSAFPGFFASWTAFYSEEEPF
jgi:hypothetical protein